MLDLIVEMLYKMKLFMGETPALDSSFNGGNLRNGLSRKTTLHRFTKGYLYQYDDVPREVFLSLLNAESLGCFFNFSIKNCYRYQAL